VAVPRVAPMARELRWAPQEEPYPCDLPSSPCLNNQRIAN
jgi:hypothetical protein